MFITTDDLKGKIQTEVLNQITEEDADVTDSAFKFAEDTLSNKLGARYNMTDELGKTDADRDGTLLEYALNLAIFRIYERMPDLDIPERNVKLYDDTMTDLDNLNTGKTSLANLTKLTDSDGNKVTKFYWGSTTKRVQNPF